MASRQPPAPTLAELRPMLLCERKTIPRGPGWHFEIKYDGYRLLATTGDAPRLKSPNRLAPCAGWLGAGTKSA